MIFTNIERFEQRMEASDVSVAFFTIQYHNCSIETAYSSKQRKFLFAFVDHNLGFTCSLKGNYASAFINHQEAVEQLKLCRGHHQWDPKHFYQFLNDLLPTIGFTEATYTQYVRTVSKAVSNFEDRIYFNHWRNAKISPKQKKKAIELMGYEVVSFCEENRLTPVFWPYPTQRAMIAFGDFSADYGQNGTEQ